MSEKNVQIKIKNGENWDDLFPKTKASIVTLNTSKTVEETINSILSTLNNKASIGQVEEKITSIVGSAPAALDTLKELATALNNDSNFATTITNSLGRKVDKVAGKQLSTQDFTTELKSKLEKLKINTDGTAKITQYTHPATHPATMITQDGTHKFVSDSEKSMWNSKTKISIGKTEDKSANVWFQEI